MILKSSNNKKVEIRIKNFDLPDGASDMDFLRVKLHVSTGKKNWEAEHPCFTPREATALSKWMRKLAEKEHRYRNSLKFHAPGLSFKGEVLKGGIKKVIISLDGECKPQFIKTRKPYIIPLELTDKELKQAAFDLKNEIPPHKKMTFSDIIKMDGGTIKELVLAHAPDTIRFAEGKKIKNVAVKDEKSNQVSVLIKHTEENEKCNDGNDLFWTPFIIEAAKRKSRKNKLPANEFYEQALKKNFCTLLAEMLVNHFKKVFFEIDARYKNSREQGVRSSEKDGNSREQGVRSSEEKEHSTDPELIRDSTPNSELPTPDQLEYKPGRMDESFIDFYEDEFYKEDADKLIGSVYVNFSFYEITYNPLCISFNVSPQDGFMLLFDNNFKMMLHFLNTFAPAAFSEAIKNVKAPDAYQKIKLEFTYKLNETFKHK